MQIMRLADEALATSVIKGVPLFFTIRAINVARFAVNTTVNIFLYVEKKLSGRIHISKDRPCPSHIKRLTGKVA